MAANDAWTPRKLILASIGVAVLSSLMTGGLVVWLLSGKKAPETAVFDPSAMGNAPAPAAAPAGTPPADLVGAGNWHYDRQHWNEAIQSYENALTAGFDNPDVRTDLGNCYRFSDRADAALEQYQIAQKQNPQHEHSLYNQASLYAEVLKDPAKANEVARLFLERFPASTNRNAIQKYLTPL